MGRRRKKNKMTQPDISIPSQPGGDSGISDVAHEAATTAANIEPPQVPRTAPHQVSFLSVTQDQLSVQPSGSSLTASAGAEVDGGTQPPAAEGSPATGEGPPGSVAPPVDKTNPQRPTQLGTAPTDTPAATPSSRLSDRYWVDRPDLLEAFNSVAKLHITAENVTLPDKLNVHIIPSGMTTKNLSALDYLLTFHTEFGPC